MLGPDLVPGLGPDEWSCSSIDSMHAYRKSCAAVVAVKCACRLSRLCV